MNVSAICACKLQRLVLFEYPGVCLLGRGCEYTYACLSSASNFASWLLATLPSETRKRSLFDRCCPVCLASTSHIIIQQPTTRPAGPRFVDPEEADKRKQLRAAKKAATNDITSKIYSQRLNERKFLKAQVRPWCLVLLQVPRFVALRFCQSTTCTRGGNLR